MLSALPQTFVLLVWALKVLLSGRQKAHLPSFATTSAPIPDFVKSANTITFSLDLVQFVHEVVLKQTL